MHRNTIFWVYLNKNSKHRRCLLDRWSFLMISRPIFPLSIYWLNLNWSKSSIWSYPRVIPSSIASSTSSPRSWIEAIGRGGWLGRAYRFRRCPRGDWMFLRKHIFFLRMFLVMKATSWASCTRIRSITVRLLVVLRGFLLVYWWFRRICWCCSGAFVYCYDKGASEFYSSGRSWRIAFTWFSSTKKELFPTSIFYSETC